MADPTFTLEHDEQKWRVDDGNKRAIYLTRYGTGQVTLTPFPHVDEQHGFVFIKSDPNVVLAIGRLLIAAARKAGATDA